MKTIKHSQLSSGSASALNTVSKNILNSAQYLSSAVSCDSFEVEEIQKEVEKLKHQADVLSEAVFTIYTLINLDD